MVESPLRFAKADSSALILAATFIWLSFTATTKD